MTRRLPFAYRKEAQQEVHWMKIDSSFSPWSSPVVLVQKEDGTIRFCVNLRKLNEVTVNDIYSLPCIDSGIDNLSGTTLFTPLDLQSGYWQCEVASEDRSSGATFF